MATPWDGEGQPEWDNTDYARDFVWLGQPRGGSMDQPSIGRAVHYVDPYTGAHRAAIITEVKEPEDGAVYVALCIMHPGTIEHAPKVPLDPGMGTRTWHWPERV